MTDTRGLPRVGIGVDVHAFAPEGADRELWIAGLLWPGERGSRGTPMPTSPRTRPATRSSRRRGSATWGALRDRPARAGRASGATLLGQRRRGWCGEAGFQIGNVSVQVIGNRPKIGTRREEAQRVLAEVVGAPGLGQRHDDGRPRPHRPR